MAQLGVSQAVITPGSRNTPLAIAFAERPDISHSVHLDERSAAFFALGAAKATGSPAVLICTSGTAAAEYTPAVHEAAMARVPLVVITADRPPELRDVSAPQAIDQRNLYAGAVKWSHELATPQAGLESYVCRVGAQAWTSALEAPAGPVHINVPLREPLSPMDRVIPVEAPIPQVRLSRPVALPADVKELAASLSDGRTLLVAGPSAKPTPGILALAESIGAPVFADPLSNLRRGHSHVVCTGDTLARCGLLDGDLRPDRVIRFGAPPTSKALGQWLAANPAVAQILIDHGGWRAPEAVPITAVRADPEATATSLAELATAHPGHLEAWQAADATVRQAWRSLPFPSEPEIVRLLDQGLPGGGSLWVASSMPIRDVDSFWEGREDAPALRANRGANGIDGLISTALGSAVATGGATSVLTGDLSLLHDLTALVTAKRLGVDLTIVLVDNNGGGIFHFLPQADHPEFFEELLVAPHDQDLGALLRGFDVDVGFFEESDDFRQAVSEPAKGVRVLGVRTERSANHALHQDLLSAAAAALATTR